MINVQKLIDRHYTATHMNELSTNEPLTMPNKYGISSHELAEALAFRGSIAAICAVHDCTQSEAERLRLRTVRPRPRRARQTQQVNVYTIHVVHESGTVDAHKLGKLFGKLGEVAAITLKETRDGRSYAFVAFLDLTTQQNALKVTDAGYTVNPARNKPIMRKAIAHKPTATQPRRKYTPVTMTMPKMNK